MSLQSILWMLVRHGQKFMVYPSAYEPKPRSIFLPSELGLAYTNLELRTSDKVKLRCFFLRYADQSAARIRQCTHEDIIEDEAPPDFPNTGQLSAGTVVVFHGNGMNCGDMSFAAKRFLFGGCDVLIVSYRGYAESEGSPHEKGLRLDAQAALDHVLAQPDLAKRPIILYGTSLGGAVAIDLASRNPETVSAIIVENTFLSLPRVVRDWPVIGPFSFLCFQRWDSASKIKRIPRSTPILMLSGAQDEIVPPKHMSALWDLAQKRGPQGSQKECDRFESFGEGCHPDTFTCPGYWEKVSEFLRVVSDKHGTR
ncbi:unnamed protein product [Mycena citricolor]|uniref:Serine aminopeptidase S33 domain-containing protein n=2 Tax=Mycena citricolor TaxID=2018698 RepID=A0AAD2H7B8_9AGAR|nr:unnamed protein product [Mycena citricolor]